MQPWPRWSCICSLCFALHRPYHSPLMAEGAGLCTILGSVGSTFLLTLSHASQRDPVQSQLSLQLERLFLFGGSLVALLFRPGLGTHHDAAFGPQSYCMPWGPKALSSPRYQHQGLV